VCCVTASSVSVWQVRRVGFWYVTVRSIRLRFGRCGAASYVKFRWDKVRCCRVGSVEVGHGRYVWVCLVTLS